MKFLSREETGIQDREGGTRWDESALLGVTIHHFGSPRAADNAAESKRIWLGVDNSHESGDYSDIAYNFGFDDFDQVFEGRGWDWMTGANGTSFANANYVSFVYMGNSGLDDFSQVAQKNMALFLDRAFDKGVGMVVVPHKKWVDTGCPGRKGLRWVRGGWKDDMPSEKPKEPARVQFFLLDDGDVIDKSAIEPKAKSEELWNRFRNSDAADRAHRRMVEEGRVGNVTFSRKVLR